jgi:hypothetical protein
MADDDKAEDKVIAHIDTSEIEPQEKPPRDDGKCQYCGGDTDIAYGMAGGGMGAYAFCTVCERITDKWQDPELDDIA